jgi:hypothetical protein
VGLRAVLDAVVKRKIPRQDLINEVDKLKYDLRLNGYPLNFIDLSINKSVGRIGPENEKTRRGSVVIPHMKGTSEKLENFRESLRY